MSRIKRTRAFTLIELITVIVIIALLSAAAAVSLRTVLGDQTSKALDAAMATKMVTYHSQTLPYATNGGTTTNIQDAIKAFVASGADSSYVAPATWPGATTAATAVNAAQVHDGKFAFGFDDLTAAASYTDSATITAGTAATLTGASTNIIPLDKTYYFKVAVMSGNQCSVYKVPVYGIDSHYNKISSGSTLGAGASCNP